MERCSAGGTWPARARSPRPARSGSVGGIQEKIAGAEKAGATEFFVPAGNCADLDGLRTNVRLIRVSNLRDAIAALQTLNGPGPAGALPSC